MTAGIPPSQTAAEAGEVQVTTIIPPQRTLEPRFSSWGGLLLTLIFVVAFVVVLGAGLTYVLQPPVAPGVLQRQPACVKSTLADMVRHGRIPEAIKPMDLQEAQAACTLSAVQAAQRSAIGLRNP